MVIVANDIDVSTFTANGNRDQLRLKAGTKVRPVYQADALHVVCSIGIAPILVYVVIPSGELQNMRVQGASFLDRLKKNVGEALDVETYDPVAEEEEESSYRPYGETTQEEKRLPPAKVLEHPIDAPEEWQEERTQKKDPTKPQLITKRPFSGHDYQVLEVKGANPPDRFWLTAIPVRSKKIGYVYRLLDIVYLETYDAKSKEEAMEKAGRIIQLELAGKAPKSTSYKNFDITRESDPSEKPAFTIFFRGTKILEDTFETVPDAQAYIGTHLAELIVLLKKSGKL